MICERCGVEYPTDGRQFVGTMNLCPACEDRLPFIASRDPVPKVVPLTVADVEYLPPETFDGWKR